MIAQLMNFVRDCMEFWRNPSQSKTTENLEEIVIIEDSYYDAQTEKWIHYTP